MKKIATTPEEIRAAYKANNKYLTAIGSNWGGYSLDLDLVTEKSVIISGGLANDISADKKLIDQKQCFIIGIDPTKLAFKTWLRYVIRRFKKRKHFTLIRRAIHAKSDLTISLGGPAQTLLSPFGEKAKTISLDDIMLTYQGASVLKLDIEGAEFPALEGLTVKLRVPQINMGFHVWLNSSSDQYPNDGVPPGVYTKEDVLAGVKKIKDMGYKLVYELERNIEDKERIGAELLFIRSDFADKYQDTELLIE